MPHIRKPSKIGLQSNTNDNGKLSNNAKKARVEKKISKVDQATQEKIIKFDGSEGNGKETGDISTSDGKKSDGSDTKPVCDKKSAYGKTSDGASKKIEGCAKGRSPKAVKETGNGNFKNTENASIFTENFSGKEKKVKFTEGWSSKQSEGYRKSFSGYLGGKSDKQKQFYSSYKSEAKDVLPLPQPSEVYVPQLGEIAVLTDLVPDDPISACLPCLEANGTYICTPCNPRCFIIQKVTTSPTGSVTAAGPSAPTTTSVALNPNADVFERSEESQSDEVIEQTTPDTLKPEEEGAEEDEGETPGSDSSSWTSNTAYLSGDSYAYMNGDVGKLPSGVVYTSTPDPLASSTDYSTLNGVADAVDHYETREGAGVGPIGPLVPSPPAGGAQDSNGIPLEQLKQMLLSQLEYYFSRENLANDAYLISQMDNDQYVPIWTVANFNQVKKLTTDIKLITEVLRESPNVQVDEEGQKVRPNHKRCIVILREIPDSTPLEDIKNLFSGEGCPRLISCEFAHNNSWYVTFESDEDAQRAYSFLREEVKVFQGKPIMARIKAKPMNRLPLPPVGGGGLGSMKNGYRTPPATYDPNAGPFQAPPPNPGAQQRFVYTNGSSIPPTVNYGNQVHVYTFQQPNQPFYPPTMLPWAAANNCYYDIGSVFSVNGLAPQQSFAKPANTRYVPRTRGNKRPQGSDRASLPDTGNTGLSRHHMTTGMSPAAIAMTAGTPVVKTVSNLNSTKVQPLSVVEQNHSKNQPHMHSSNVVQAHTESLESAMTSRLSESQDNVFRQNKDKPDANSSSFNADRHRRRRKDDDSASTTQSQQQNNLRTSSLSASVGGKQNLPASNSPQLGQSQGQFDLEATAFPPLPGIEAGTGTVVKAAPVEVTTPIDSNSQLHWGENRLADVVKGTAKPKPNSSIKEKDDSPRPSSPAQLPQAPPPAVKSVLTGTSAADVQEKPSRTAQASSQTSRAEQLTISTSNQAQQTASPTDPPTSKSDGKEIALSSCDASVATNSNILTPPPSPIKCVVPAAKCMTADKSTKTDDILLNGEPEKAENQVAALKPTTTNAATMTSSIAVETDFSVSNPSSSNGSQMDLPPRLSYAQVAQHHKEKAERMAKEKQGSETEKEKEKEKEKKKDVAFTREVREKKDSGEGFREVTSRSTGRGGARQSSASQGPRRREGAQSDRVPRTRELTSRQRSPK